MSDRTVNPHPGPERLQALLEGQLSAEERLSLEEHVASCARCSAEVEAWTLLFSTLGELPELSPREGFDERVMADVRLAGKIPVAARARERLGAVWARGRRAHPGADRLQELAEGALSAAQAARVRAHLRGCDACAREAEAWSGLMARLGALPELTPTEEFEDRVMEKVRIPAPAPVAETVSARGRALAAMGRIVPRTRRAWAAITGVAVTPMATLGLALYAMFSHPALTPGALVSFAWWHLSDLALGTWHALVARLLESDSLFRAWALLGSVTTSPWVVLGGFVGFSILIGAALWVLYRNVVVTPAVEGGYAHVDS